MILFENVHSQFFLGACIFVWTFWGQFGGFCVSEIKKSLPIPTLFWGIMWLESPPPKKKTVLTKLSWQKDPACRNQGTVVAR